MSAVIGKVLVMDLRRFMAGGPLYINVDDVSGQVMECHRTATTTVAHSGDPWRVVLRLLSGTETTVTLRGDTVVERTQAPQLPDLSTIEAVENFLNS